MFAVELKNITKTFPGVIANSNVNFSAEWGHIYGLIGENGAGKTTLMKVLYGMYKPDQGEVWINGEKKHFDSPKDAINSGIGMVHQHFTLVPSLTVTQNIILGNPITKKNGIVDIAKAEKVIHEMCEKYGLEVDPKAIVKDLPVGLQQRVEILKALYLGADILIMDEPTAVLTPQEISQLFNTLTSLKEQGKTIIIITHKLKELLNVTDYITVLRNGIVTGNLETVKTSEKEIAKLMVGKDMKFSVDKTPATPGEEVLTVKNLTYYDKWGVKVLDDVNLSICRGEILGIAGVQGNGQSELIDAISGIQNNYSGQIIINGHEVSPQMSTKQRRDYGLGHIPEDRQTRGAALTGSILENFIMAGYRKKNFSKNGFIDYKKAEKITWENIKKYEVKTPDIYHGAYSLSGGNLQKAIIAREIFLDPVIMIAAQPSRGVDIGATMYIHERLIEMRDEGKAILLVSNELSEIMALSDRILVIYNGKIVGETTPKESNEEQIGLLMAGISQGGAI